MSRVFFSLLLVFISVSSWATLDEIEEGEKLAKGCVELTQLYTKRHERSFVASRFASSADTLLAGYCLGTVQAYKRFEGSNRCYEEDWYEMATYIAGGVRI